MIIHDAYLIIRPRMVEMVKKLQGQRTETAGLRNTGSRQCLSGFTLLKSLTEWRVCCLLSCIIKDVLINS